MNPLVVSRVIGDVIDPFTATTEFRVTIDGRSIYNGYRLRPSQVAARPRVEIGGEEFRTLHTLVSIIIYTYRYRYGHGYCVCV